MLVAFKFARVEIGDGHVNNRSKILYKATKDEESIIEPDRTRLSHVISNLLDNAIKFTKEEEGGTISIVVEKKKDSQHCSRYYHRVLVSVDENSGMSNTITRIGKAERRRLQRLATNKDRLL